MFGALRGLVLKWLGALGRILDNGLGCWLAVSFAGICFEHGLNALHPGAGWFAWAAWWSICAVILWRD